MADQDLVDLMVIIIIIIFSLCCVAADCWWSYKILKLLKFLSNPEESQCSSRKQNLV